MSVCLVIGASGQIGRFLLPRLLGAGHQVLALSRESHPSRHVGLRWLVGDVYAGPTVLPRLDVIFSLGPLDGFAEWLERVTLAGSPRVIAFGSMSAISKRESPDPLERALAERLLASERRVATAAQAGQLSWTILRPTLIYGAGLDRSLSALVRLGRRLRLFPHVAGAEGLRQPVHAEDLADACVAVWRSGSTRGNVYALGGGERLPFSDMLERVRRSLGVRSLALPVPLGAARGMLAIARIAPPLRALRSGALQRLQQDLVADNADAHRDFGWSPRGFAPQPSTWAIQPLA